MANFDDSVFPVRVATTEVLAVAVSDAADNRVTCELRIRTREGVSRTFSAAADSPMDAVVAAIGELCVRPLVLSHVEQRETSADHSRCVVAVQEASSEGTRSGAGRATASSLDSALTIATLRAANHAGLLKPDYRANNQKVLRDWSKELVQELESLDAEETPMAIKRLEAEGVVLEAFNRVASAAVITAANHPQPDTILRLFDTSAWLFDSDGRPRDAYTDTSLWLAWYPGIRNGEQTVDEVIRSMPAAPDVAIPWIVKLFENPTSRLRFRGAVDLEDHDVLHVLLGRGLQDQDEAFVLGFAMGTAKKVTRIETYLFKMILARLYPEPYRIPTFLQPAFDLGVECGTKTGAMNLYKRSLKDLRGLTLGQARKKAGIDMNIVRDFYQLEQQQIPFTIASLRLP